MQIIITPILINSLGIRDFAIYNFLIGISSWFIILDFAISTIIQNNIIKNETDGADSNEIIVYYFYLLIMLYCFYILFFTILTPVFLKLFLVKLNGGFSYSLISVWLIFIVFYVSNSLLQNVIKIYYAKGLSYKINLYVLIGNLLTFVIVFIVSKMKGALNEIIPVTVVFSIMVNLVAFIRIKKVVKVPFNMGKIKAFAFEQIQKSKHFLFFTISGMLVLQLDYFLIAYFFNSSELIKYNFTSKIFTAIYGFYSIILINYYPVFASLIHQKKFQQLFKNVSQNISIGVLIILCCFLIFIFYRADLAIYFLKGKVLLSVALIVLFTIYYLIRVWVDTFANLLVILNDGKYLFKMVVWQVLLSAPLQLFLIKKLGLNGLMIGLIISFLFSSLVFFPKRVVYLLK